MKKNNLEKCNVVELTNSQLVEFEGGKPTAETSLAYDIVWGLTTVLLALGKGAGSVKG